MKAVSYIVKIATLFLIVTLTACRHKDLCLDHDAHSPRYQLNILADYELEWEYPYKGYTNWENQWPQGLTFSYKDLRPTDPTGLRMLAYGPDGKYELSNIPAKGDKVRFKHPENSLLFYNNDTEAIIFNNLDVLASAKATTRTRVRTSYTGNPYITADVKELTITEPDMLFGFYAKDVLLEKTTKAEDFPILLKPLVYTYVIRYEFQEGLKYVSLSRGALAGMAASVYLNSGKTADNAATILYDCKVVKDFGCEAIVKTFGIPDFPNDNYGKGQRVYALNLEVRLKNGLVKTFNFDVTDQVECQPHGGIIHVGGLKVEKDDGEKGGGGFDVDVDDWGEYEDIILPL